MRNRYGKVYIDIGYNHAIDTSEETSIVLDDYLQKDVFEFIKNFNSKSLKECILKFTTNFGVKNTDDGTYLDLSNYVIPATYYADNQIRYETTTFDENDNLVHFLMLIYFDNDHVVMEVYLTIVGGE